MNYSLRSTVFAVVLTFLTGYVANAQQHGDACPNLTISGPAEVVSAGSRIKFTASVGYPELKNVTYNWTVSAGSILSGQGTPTIEVDPKGVEGEWITAVVQVTSDSWMMACQTTAQETAFVAPKPPVPVLLDTASTAANNCEYVLMTLDRLFTELANDPNASGVVVIYRDAAKPRAHIKRRYEITDWLRIRGFDRARLTILDGPFHSKAVTEFWVRPAGAEMPELKSADVTAPSLPSAEITPYLHSAAYSDGIEGCSGPALDPDGFAAELASKPHLRGKAVIAETSAKNYRRVVSRIAAALRKAHVSPTRVRYVFKHVKPRALAEYTELWIVKK